MLDINCDCFVLKELGGEAGCARTVETDLTALLKSRLNKLPCRSHEERLSVLRVLCGGAERKDDVKVNVAALLENQSDAFPCRSQAERLSGRTPR